MPATLFSSIVLPHIADIMPTCIELAGVTHPETFRDMEQLLQEFGP